MAEIVEYRKGRETFRPRARLVSVLGEQLIRDATVGLLELVKNGYDADANHVTVRLLNLADPEDTIVAVEDDGYGMDLDTVLYKWLEPATGHKEEAKKRNERTPKGRLPLGEKGVGRFAAHKIGRQLTLISRSRNENGELANVEVVVQIDWDRFEDPEAYLSDIAVDYQERTPEHFLNHSGTYMEMRRARSRWLKRDVERISRTLRRLMSPFRTPESFGVTLRCPEFPQFENLDAGELLKTTHSELIVVVDDTGIAEYEYRFKLPPYPTRSEKSDPIDLRQRIKSWNPPDRKPECGAFYVALYIWDRAPDSLKLSGTNAGDLNQYNGVAVFRDGIRVMPYGEPEDDWLEIDHARYMRTSDAFERKNVVGMVEINQAHNKKLHDKSNREGFIENSAYFDLRDLMLAVMNIAYNEFSRDRKEIRVAEKKAKRELLPAVSQLETSINTVANALSQTREMANSYVQKGQIAPEVAQEMMSTLQQTGETLATAVQETKEAAADTVSRFDEEREMLLALAGLGLAAERFTHEFARMTREASDLLRDIEKDRVIQRANHLKSSVEALGVTLEALRDLVLALGPMFYIRRRTSEQLLNVKTIIEHALLLNKGQIQENKIVVDIQEPHGALSVKMRRGALTQVFNNLIDNACYWLSRKSEENDRRLRIIILAEDRAALISDNGPGIHPRDQHRIFDVFFSTKTEGRGLGLFITREALAEAQATITLLEPGEYSEVFRIGAGFKIQFPEWEGNEK
jgi:signal transduction histidine kinase